MAFRTAFVLCLVLVPYALGATKRFKRDAMDTANQAANQAFDNMQSNFNIGQLPSSLQDIVSSFSSEQQEALRNFENNENFVQDYAKLEKEYAGNTDSKEYKQAQKDLFTRYLNGGAGLVVSLVALVASLVVQGLVMFG
ncbi:uncharacterized protein [Littorina saxatilis]|uniref:Uncharacterized protein n=1 Tax=Littorina saxatilis TaxID=31220 RepID=A0AAN9G0F6_9CAEN